MLHGLQHDWCFTERQQPRDVREPDLGLGGGRFQGFQFGKTQHRDRGFRELALVVQSNVDSGHRADRAEFVAGHDLIAQARLDFPRFLRRDVPGM